LTVPELRSFPEEIIAGIERPAVLIELVGEDELVFFTVETNTRLCFFGSVTIYRVWKLE
jgi:hypothetical protein